MGVPIIGEQLHLRLRADIRGSRHRRGRWGFAGTGRAAAKLVRQPSGRRGTSHSSVPSGPWPFRQDRHCQMRLTDASHRPRCVLCRLGAPPRRNKTVKDALFAELGDGQSPVRSVVGVPIIGGQLHLRLRADIRGSRHRRAGGVSAGPEVRLQNLQFWTFFRSFSTTVSATRPASEIFGGDPVFALPLKIPQCGAPQPRHGHLYNQAAPCSFRRGGRL